MEQKKFIKMQGLGNDFVVFFWDGSLPSKKLIRNLSNRKIGIGCDLSLFLKKSENDLVDYEATFFNSDGSINTKPLKIGVGNRDFGLLFARIFIESRREAM